MWRAITLGAQRNGRIPKDGIIHFSVYRADRKGYKQEGFSPFNHATFEGNKDRYGKASEHHYVELSKVVVRSYHEGFVREVDHALYFALKKRYSRGLYSEILAVALRDNGRVRLLDGTTAGTGTVLAEFPLEDGSSMLLGVAEWLTLNGDVIQEPGIIPAVEAAL